MIGTTVSHYRIVDEIGKGGMGVVYKAEDTKLDRTIALKLLAPHMLASESDRNRFYREARAAAALHHPNIATVFEIDETRDGRPFIAMEFIEGQSLEELIAEGPLRLDTAISYAIQIAEALKAAHAKEIVHRDIKSANVMLTKDGRAKVLDFGLAKTTASTKLTQMGSTLGTVAYMSPEQTRGQEVDHRTDLWSLGAVLYEMVSGKLPFAGDYEQAVVYNILNDEPQPLTAIRTGVPMELEQVVNKCLRKESELRYQSAAGLIADLKALDNRHSASTTARHSVAYMPAPPDAEPLAPIKSRAKSKAFVGGAAVAGLALLLTATYFLGKAAPNTSAGAVPVHLDLPLEDGVQIGSPSWSPSGRYLFYVRVDGWDTVVESYELRTGQRRQYRGTSGARYISAAPDDESFVFAVGTRLLWLTIDAVEPNPIVDVGFRFGTVAWSGRNTLVYIIARSILEKDLETGAIDTLATVREVTLETGERVSPIFIVQPVTAPKSQQVYFSIFRPDIRFRMAQLDRRTGNISVVGAGIPIEITPNRFLVTFDPRDKWEFVAHPVDRHYNLSGSSLRLFDGLWFNTSAAGHAIYRTGLGLAEPFHAVRASGERVMLGEIPGIPSIGSFTASADGSQIVSSGAFQTLGASLALFDTGDGSSRRLEVGFRAGRPAFSASGWLYFNDTATPRSIYRLRPARGGQEEVELVLSDSLESEFPAADESGRVVFVRSESGTRRIFLYDPRTNQTRRVSDQTGSQSFPTIHPEGEFVAYQNSFEGRATIVVEELSTGKRETVTDAGTRPTFSLDGNALFYIEANTTRVHRIAIRVAGGQLELGKDEIVAFEPFMDHVHYAPGTGDVVVYTAAPSTAFDSTDPYRVVLNYDVYLDELSGRSKR